MAILISIVDAQNNTLKYKIRDDYNIAKLLIAWCQREGKSYETSVLTVVRTGEIVSLYDYGRTCAHLQDGDVLRELVN
jgi:hypothetical protein